MSSWKQLLNSGMIPLPNDSYKNNFLCTNSTGTEYEFKGLDDVRDEINQKDIIDTPVEPTTDFEILVNDFYPGNPNDLEGYYVEALITIQGNHIADKSIHYVLNAHRRLVFNIVYDINGIAWVCPVGSAANYFVVEHGGSYYNVKSGGLDFGVIPLDEIPVKVETSNENVIITVSNSLGEYDSGIIAEVPIPLFFSYEIKVIRNPFGPTE